MKLQPVHKRESAFTLIELIIVIAIIAILAAAIFVAIDPARRLHEARNAVRASDVATILEAVKKRQADQGGTHYTTIANLTAGSYHVIGTCATGATCTAVSNQTSCVNLTGMEAYYLAEIPEDPDGDVGSTSQTGYYLMRGTANEIYVGACEPEGEGPGGMGTAPTIQLVR